MPTSDIFSVTFDTKELIRATQWIGNFDRVINDPDVMSPAVNAVGDALSSVFAVEGSPSWTRLANYTQQVREQRFGSGRRAHPILQQTGGLYKASVGSLREWSAANRPSGDGGETPTRFTGTMTPRHFSATLSGAKVENQFGGMIGYERMAGPGGFGFQPGTGFGYLPPRPFFYVPVTAAYGMAAGVLNKVEGDWSKSGGQFVRRSGRWPLAAGPRTMSRFMANLVG